MARWKAGLIGLGGVADRIHLPAIQNLPDVDLCGACDIDPARRSEMQKKWKIENCFADAQEMLEHCKPDFVIIGTPPDSHRDMCLLALRYGAHLFCEKPFVSSVYEASEVIATAEDVQRAVAVNNQYRYMETYRQTAKKIKQGEFGRLYLAQCWQQMYHPPSFERNWRAKLPQYILLEFGTHALDLLCYFFDAYPESIFAQIPRPLPDSQSEVTAIVTLTFPAERVATLVFNRISHAPERYFEMRLDCMDASIRISLGGVARASMDWSPALGRPTFRASLVKGGEARVEKAGKSSVIARDRRDAFASATALHLREFLSNLAAGNISTAPARHAKRLLEIVFAAYRSAETGTAITFGVDLNPLPS